MNPPTFFSSRLLVLTRVFQILVICLTIGLFIASIPLNYAERSVICEVEPCPPGQLSYKSEEALSQIGLTIDSLVKLTLGLDILLTAVFTISAVVIFIRKPDDPFTIFVSTMLVTFGVATFTGGLHGIGATNTLFYMLTKTIVLIGN